MTDIVPVPVTPDDLSARWLTVELEHTGALNRAAVVGFESEIVGEDRGFTGVIVRLQLVYDGDAEHGPASLVAKFPLAERAGDSNYRRAQSANSEMFRRYVERCAREVEFYRLTDGELSHSARYYFGHADADAGEIVLLLEDLSSGVPGDALAGCSVDQARSLLQSIAGVHSRWWHGEGLQSANWLPGWEDANAGRAGRLHERVELVVERHAEHLPTGIVDLVRALPNHYERILAGLDAAPTTLIHADLHLDNVIFVADSDVTDARIIDWQSVQRGPAMLDVAGFLVEALDIEDRRSVELDLLHEYHASLIASGVADYDFGRLFEDYLRALLVRLAGNLGWLAGVHIDGLSGRERALVEALLEPGKLFVALTDHEVGKHLGII